MTRRQHPVFQEGISAFRSKERKTQGKRKCVTTPDEMHFLVHLVNWPREELKSELPGQCEQGWCRLTASSGDNFKSDLHYYGQVLSF